MHHPVLRLVSSAVLAGCLSALIGLPAGLHAAPKKVLAEVVANAELTQEGRQAPRPTPGHPIYYVPVIHGWNETGAVVGGEEPPKRAEVLRQLAQALAKEGYVLQALRPDANTTVPSLIIHIAWGYLNPDALEVPAPPGLGGDSSTAPEPSTTVNFNQGDMMTLVLGSAVGRVTALTPADWDKVKIAAGEGRYFILVSAYDFASSVKGEQKLLWCTRMSTARQGVWMSDVVPALVTAGASLFGRDSALPVWKSYPVREGRVDLGELQVLDSDVKVPAEKKP